MIMMRSVCVRYNKFSTGVVQFTLFIAADDESYRLPLHVRNTMLLNTRVYSSSTHTLYYNFRFFC